MASHLGTAAQTLEEAAAEALDPDSVAVAVAVATSTYSPPTSTLSFVSTTSAAAVREMFSLPGSLRHLRPWNTLSDIGRAAPTVAARSLALVRRHADDDEDDEEELDDGAVAGVVVGVVIFALLLALCLYPVIVHCFKKRRNNALSEKLDTEAAMVPGAKPVGHPRPSSDSIPHGPLLTRGHTFDDEVRGGKEEPAPIDGPDPLLLGFGCYDPATHQGTIEYMPQDLVDDQPGVLKGTSEDYYRPSIPSEAFGMISTPEPIAEVPIRSLSRAGTFGHNVKHMFARRSRDRTMSSNDSSHPSDTQSPSTGPAPLPTIITSEEAVAASPTELSPTSSALPSLPGPDASPYTLSRSPEPLTKSPPSPLGERGLSKSPSPPYNPAPGTVNPMDIMAPSTQSEFWHRTEHQLFTSSHESTPPLPQPLISEPEGQISHTTSDGPSPKTTPDQKTGAGTGPSNAEASEAQDVVMQEVQPQKYLSSNTIPENGRHPSFPSEHSTPLPGQAFTDVSSQTTPSTQIDSPSPASMNSSDFRHSASPGKVTENADSVPSPKPNGLYHCDEPGCNQTFDQPHKLKHHQRYHSKDHKCHYSGCGKGFGTKTHLQRHINDRHEKKKKFHCSIAGCDYSSSGGRAFPRKDNWKRHMTKIHNMEQHQLPEPVEVDVDMGGS